MDKGRFEIMKTVITYSYEFDDMDKHEFQSAHDADKSEFSLEQVIEDACLDAWRKYDG